MSEINYTAEFVERTKQLLEQVYEKAESENLENTFLMNCLLGLVVAVSELKKGDSKKYFDQKINDELLAKIPNKVGYLVNNSEYNLLGIESSISFEIGKRENLSAQTASWLLGKIRNGIAHQNIEAINSNGKWNGVKIWNHDKQKRKDFEIEFTNFELKDFTLFISLQYIAHIPVS